MIASACISFLSFPKVLSKHKAPVAKQKNPESSRRYDNGLKLNHRFPLSINMLQMVIKSFKHCSMADFIVDDSDMSDCAVEEDSDELDESVFYIRTDRSLNNKALRPRAQNRVGNFDSDTDSSEDETKERREVFKTPGAVPGLWLLVYCLFLHGYFSLAKPYIKQLLCEIEALLAPEMFS